MLTLALGSNRNGLFCLIVLSLLQFGFTGPAIGAVTVVSDSSFGGADWSVTVVKQEGGATYSQAQEGSGGNPTDYRRMQHTVPGVGAVNVFHQYTAASFDPSVQGAIATLDYAEDQIELLPPFSGATIGAASALRQGGAIYIGPSVSFTNTSWGSASRLGLTESSFVNELLENPDFSESGGVIDFGYMRGNSSGNGSTFWTTTHGIDNWSFTIYSIDPVNPVPVMSVPALIMLAAALGAAVIFHRRALAQG